MNVSVVVVDCAVDRHQAAENLEALRTSVNGRARIVVATKTGLAPIASYEATIIGATRGECMRAGLDHLVGIAVLFSDTDTRVDSGWFDAARSAFESGTRLVCGRVGPDATRKKLPVVTACGYALDYGRHCARPYLNAEGHPSANNFGASRSLIDSSAGGPFWKSQFCGDLKVHGITAMPIDGMDAESTKRYTLVGIAVDQMRRGWLHASLQCSHMTQRSRGFRVFLVPLVPMVSMFRLLREPGYRPPLMAWPLIAIGLSAWAVGEGIGYSLHRPPLRKDVFG